MHNPKEHHPLILHYGLLHRELEPAFIASVRAIKQADPLEPVVVLVGSRLLAEYFGWRFVDRGLDLFNVRFLTFADLGRDLSLETRFNDPRPSLPPEGDFVICHKIVKSLKTPHYFDKVIERTGFIRALVSTFSDLDEALIDVIDAAVHDPGDRSQKLTSLAEMRREYLDSVSSFHRSLDDLKPPLDSYTSYRKIYRTNRLFIYGLYDFNAAQRNLLRSLAGEIELTIFLPCTGGDVTGGAFEFAMPTRRMFAKMQRNLPPPYSPPAIAGGECAIDRPVIVGGKLEDDTAAIAERDGYGNHLFSFKQGDRGRVFTPQDRSFSIFSGFDPAAEVKGIVGRINEAALYGGVPIPRIGVLLWQSNLYIDLLRSELERAGLPCFDTIGVNLDKTSHGKALISLLDMCGQSIERRGLADLIATTDLKLANEDEIDPTCEPDPVAWEVISIETGIVEGDLGNWLSAFSYLDNKTEQEEEDSKRKSHLITHTQIQYFLRFIERLFGRFEKLPDKGRWSDFVAGVIDLTEDFLQANSIRDQIIDAISSLNELDRIQETVEREIFITAVASILGNTRLKQTKRYCTDGITICDKMTSRGVSFDLLFIPGLTQGSVPVPPREDPILRDEDRIFVNRTLFPADGSSTTNLPLNLPLKSSMHEEEKLLFALAVDAADRRLVLSYPLRGSDGKDLLPSRFLLEMCRIITGNPVETDRLAELKFYESDHTFSPVFGEIYNHNPPPVSGGGIKGGGAGKFLHRATDPSRFLLDWVRSMIPTLAQPALYRALYIDRSNNYRQCMRVAENRLRGDKFTEWEGVMPQGWSAPGVIPLKFSVTGLERYAACPFRYFISDILNGREWEEPEMLLEPPPMAIGALMHRILEQFFRQALENGFIPLKEDNLDWAREEISGLLRENLKRERARHPMPRSIWDIEAKRTETRLHRYLDEEIRSTDKMRFREAEISIDNEFTFETVEGKYRMNLSGKIDRIDMTDDGKVVRVIDYKTGNVQAKAEKFAGGTMLQLPVYLKAMLDWTPACDPEASTSEYLRIGLRGEVKSVILSGAWLSEHAAELANIIKVFTTGIRRGLFPPLPEGKNTCERCGIVYLCDLFSRKVVSYRQGDQRIAGILEVRELK